MTIMPGIQIDPVTGALTILGTLSCGPSHTQKAKLTRLYLAMDQHTLYHVQVDGVAYNVDKHGIAAALRDIENGKKLTRFDMKLANAVWSKLNKAP